MATFKKKQAALGRTNFPLKSKKSTYMGKQYEEFTGSIDLNNGTTMLITVREKTEGGFVSQVKDKSGNSIDAIWATGTLITSNKGGR